MYSFRKQDPFGSNDYGPSYERLMEPEPYLNQFQFEQNPNTPMTPPSQGIGLGGEVSQAPYMQMNAQPSPQMGATAGGLMAAGSALSKMANDGSNGIPPPPQVSMRTPQAQDMQFEYLFPLVEALQQLNKGRKRKA
jgi:hypothetical protein